MAYEWDEAKRRLNREKHGVDFEQARVFQWGTARIEPETRYAELRWRAYGYIDGRLHLLVYTMRGPAIRVISLRKTNLGETRRYAAT